MIPRAGVDDLLRLLIGEAARATNNRTCDTCSEESGLRIESEDTAIGILVLIGTERAKEVAQSTQVAWDRSIHEVHAGSSR